MRIQLLALLLLSPVALALDNIVGEWSIDSESCPEMRLIFDSEGNHSAKVFEDGGWITLAVAPYRRDGDVIIITNDEVEERLEISSIDHDRLVFRNRNSPNGDMTAEWVRCPVD